MESLRSFSLLYILAEMSKQSLYIERGSSYRYIRTPKNLSPLLEETSKAGLTSELLPETSKELFFVYNPENMQQYARDKLHELAGKILE